MSLIPNKKNKKDSRPGGAGQPSKTGGLASAKGKANTKAPSRNTKATGGSQRGS